MACNGIARRNVLGGESAANMIDNYLEPGAFDIYTDVPTAYLDEDGICQARCQWRDKGLPEVLEMGNRESPCTSYSCLCRSNG